MVTIRHPNSSKKKQLKATDVAIKILKNDTYMRDFSCFYRKPTLGIYVLQILHGQLVGFHFFIAFLNSDKVSICLITGGISSQSLGPK